MTHRNQSTGFTLVELMLSMGFISVLLLAIAMLVLQIGSIYNKGLSLRSVNEAGQLVTSDLQRSLNTSNPQEVYQAPEDSGETATGGRICIGATVYAWNFVGQIVNGENSTFAFNQYADARRDPIRLVKFISDGPNYCEQGSEGYPDLPITGVTDLLAAGDSNLAVHNLSIVKRTVGGTNADLVDPNQSMYHVVMLIGTSGTAEVNDSGCKVPDTLVDDEYCAVNEFEFIARAGNRSAK